MVKRYLTIAMLGVCLLLSGDTIQATQRNQWLPDPKLTPGATNPDITQDNIKDTICHGGGKHWTTKKIRPPASYTNKLKKRQIGEYGYSDKKLADYEEDHLISLTIGGNPTDPRNLWPQPYSGEWGARTKDKLEQRLNKLVCDGTITLKEAQKAISENWVAAYKKFLN